MKIDKIVLEKLYIEENKKQREIAKILGTIQTTVAYYVKKYNLSEIKRSTKYKNNNKYWSEEEIETLTRLYGTCSYSELSKVLGRTGKSIETKKTRLGLGGVTVANEYLTLNELAKAIGRRPNTVKRWINNLKLPGKLKVLVKSKKFYQIKVEDFWKWAKENKDLMAWDKYKINNLPNEPVWVIEEKKKKTNKSKNVKTRWNKNEEIRLVFLYKQGKTLTEIAKDLDRTMKSIDGKLVALKVKRNQVHVEWREEETKILFDMRAKGICYREIAEELGRELEVVQKKHKTLIIKQNKAITY